VMQDCEQHTQQSPFSLQDTHRRRLVDSRGAHARLSQLSRSRLSDRDGLQRACVLPASTPLFIPSPSTTKIPSLLVSTVSRHMNASAVFRGRWQAAARRSEPRRVKEADRTRQYSANTIQCRKCQSAPDTGIWERESDDCPISGLFVGTWWTCV
jgi:hypothetical protein